MPCVWSVPTGAGGGGLGKEGFSSSLHLHRFCWRQLKGPDPSLTNRGTNPYSYSTGPLNANCGTHMPWLPHPPVDKDIPGVKPFSLPRAASFFFYLQKSFLSVLDTTVHFWCIFFSDSCKLKARGGWGVCRRGLCTKRRFAGWLRQYRSTGSCAPVESLPPAWLYFFPLLSKVSKFPENWTVCNAKRVRVCISSRIE